ncbi:MAG: helix-turn-helix transcriptional regulator [Bacteroidota bacterium]
MKRNSLIEKIRNEITEDIKREVDLSFEISDRISEILAKQNKTQRDLAKSLHKSEAEVSKWMHGTHNFTINTIAKIEMVLGEKILNVSKQEK